MVVVVGAAKTHAMVARVRLHDDAPGDIVFISKFHLNGMFGSSTNTVSQIQHKRGAKKQHVAHGHTKTYKTSTLFFFSIARVQKHIHKKYSSVYCISQYHG